MRIRVRYICLSGLVTTCFFEVENRWIHREGRRVGYPGKCSGEGECGLFFIDNPAVYPSANPSKSRAEGTWYATATAVLTCICTDLVPLSVLT